MIRRLATILSVMIFTVAIFALPQQAYAACSSPTGTAAALIYNSSTKIFEYCNGNNWIDMNKAGSGTGGCTSPTANEGTLFFNRDYLKIQGCAGSVHRPLTPPMTNSTLKWTKVSAGNQFSCGIRADGTLWCWGVDDTGQLGDGTNTQYESFVPIPVSMTGVTGTAWTDVSSGNYSSCGVRNDGTAYCWGSQQAGELGIGNTTTKFVPTLVLGSPTGTAWTAVGVSVTTAGAGATACGLRDNGTLWCWGYGGSGNLGNAASSNSTTPVLVGGSPTGTAWTKFAVGSEVTCGLRDNGTLWCWGKQLVGELGNSASNTTIKNTPQAVTMTGVTGSNWTSVSVQDYEGCATRDNGGIYCWGDDTLGSMGTSGATPSTFPKLVTTTGVSGSSWTSASNGYDSVCGIRDNGTMWCWGSNTSGVLANGVADIGIPHNAPIATVATDVSGSSWTQVSMGYNHSCGIRNDGSLVCWGDNYYGALGNNIPNYALSPVKVPTTGVSGTGWTSVSLADFQNVCGLRSDGTIWCFGYNLVYGVNPANTGDVSFPMILDTTINSVTGTSWTNMSAGDASGGCGIRNNGTMWCWGGNFPGNGGGYSYGPAAVTLTGVTGSNWVFTANGANNMCGIRDDGTGYCWGSGGDSQIGNGSTADATTPKPITLTGVTGTSWSSISIGQDNACGIRNDGTGYCWGGGTAGSQGELGDGSGTSKTIPTAISLTGVTGTSWTMIDAGYTSCGIRDNGTLWCWGYGTEGTIGNNTTTAINLTPLLVFTSAAGVTGSNWTYVAAGTDHVCGIRDDGSGYCWGSAIENSNGVSKGMLGTGDLLSKLVPTRISTTGVTGTAWTQIDADDNHYNGFMTCGLRNDGTIWCWGDAGGHKLGDGEGYGYNPAKTLTGCGSPAAIPGSIIFNSVTNRMQACNGLGWIGMGPKCINNPAISFAFTTYTGLDPVTATQSSIVQISGLNCNAAISVSGPGSPQYRICADSSCATVLQGFTSTAGTVSNGQWVQLQQTTSNAKLTTQITTMTIDGVANTWSATTWDWKWAFVTGLGYTGATIGSYANADTLCAAQATAGSLPGTFKAWISTATAGQNPVATFNSAHGLGYRTPNAARTLVAASWSALIGGTIAANINTFSSGGAPSGTTQVWTNTTKNGTSVGANHCTGWSVSTGNGVYGTRTGALTGAWTNNTTAACTSIYRLYCFEQ